MASQRSIALVAAAVLVLMAPGASAQAKCNPVTAEFVLTGLSNADGNSRNHELGICLPQFTLTLSASCGLTITPKYIGNAWYSLFTTGVSMNTPNLPRASDAPASIRAAVNTQTGYFYLQPKRCPTSYSAVIKGQNLLANDVASALRKGFGVGTDVLSNAVFNGNGIALTWQTVGPVANTLTYQAIAKTGGPTTPNFNKVNGQATKYCALLDINSTPDSDANGDGVADLATVTLVGRMPRNIPGTNNWICAIAPAGGVVSVIPGALTNPNGLIYPYQATNANFYQACANGRYLYKLGGISNPGDAGTDSCTACPRGSFATTGATFCQACATNTYQPNEGQRTCNACQFGYANIAGAVRCMNCYYGRPYCSEGYTPDSLQFSCNANRMPDNPVPYDPQDGFSIMQFAADPYNGNIAAAYAPFFSNCNIAADRTWMAFNVSAECSIGWYVIGDQGNNGQVCSQNAQLTAIQAYYTAPTIIAGFSTKAAQSGFNVGVYGTLTPGSGGFDMNVFETSTTKAAIPTSTGFTTTFNLRLAGSGYSYLGGGDNSQGQNANGLITASDPCPPGTIKTNLNGDGSDDVGTDPSQLLANYCVPCGVGQYCAFQDAAGAQQCPAGTFGSIIGAGDISSCQDCPVGTFSSNPGSYQCTPCPGGTFASSTGATECAACGDGFQPATSADGSNYCQPCNAGYYRDSTRSAGCRACPAGTSSMPGSASCDTCRPGYFAAKAGSRSCSQCPRGTYQNKYGATSCVDCTAGFYGNKFAQSKCTPCPQGTYNPQKKSTSVASCLACPTGTATPSPGSASCLGCGPGFYTGGSGGLNTCSPCAAGTYSSTSGSKYCTSCPKGTFSGTSASRSCTPCGFGFYAPQTRLARCLSCPAGTYADAQGLGLCRSCPAGTYSTVLAAKTKSTCTACPAGTFGYATGATQCQTCDPGSFSAKAGQQSCDICPLGSYSSGSGSVRCLPCPFGRTTAQQGSTAATDCSISTVLNGKRK